MPTKVHNEIPAAPQGEVVTITLNTPIVREGGTITTFVLRKPKGGTLRGLSLQDLMRSDIDTILKLLPRISDPFIADHEAANLEADDLAEIGGALLGFFLTPAQKAMAAQMAGA
jgi:hypothetical protein